MPTATTTSPIPIFYSKEQSVPETVLVSSDSPSAHKPALVVQEALLRFGDKVKVVDVQPLSRDDIAMAHDRVYVDGVLDCIETNGFGNMLPEVAAALPWTAGSFYHAAKFALANQTMAMSPTSGFHHACFDRAMGFCTFNGLMIAAIKLWKERITRDRFSVGIVDFDAHYGNGTDDILSRLAFQSLVVHETFGKYAIKNISYKHWLDQLPAYLANKFRYCNIIFYQAGADPHIKDPYGGFMTTEELFERDRIVFYVAKQLHIPIVWNLAGGYQTPLQAVIDIHMNTFTAAFENQF